MRSGPIRCAVRRLQQRLQQLPLLIQQRQRLVQRRFLLLLLVLYLRRFPLLVLVLVYLRRFVLLLLVLYLRRFPLLLLMDLRLPPSINTASCNSPRTDAEAVCSDEKEKSLVSSAADAEAVSSRRGVAAPRRSGPTVRALLDPAVRELLDPLEEL